MTSLYKIIIILSSESGNFLKRLPPPYFHPFCKLYLVAIFFKPSEVAIFDLLLFSKSFKFEKFKNKK